MDGEEIDSESILLISSNKSLQQDWYNYHLIRDVLRNSLNEATLQLNIVDRIEAVLEYEPVKTASSLLEQPKPASWKNTPFGRKISALLVPISQIGLAACVALSVIIGVQSYNGEQSVSSNEDIPTFPTMPFGVNISPVGYYSSDTGNTSIDAEQQENNKHFLMYYDFEQQRRMLIE